MATTQNPLGRRRVLVVDDDGEMRALLGTTLSNAGYEVIEKADGSEVLSLLVGLVQHPDTERIDLAVLDVNMPGASGIRILAWLKRSNLILPVILITAFGSPELHEQAERLGVVKVFDKPFPLTALVDYIRNVHLPSRDI